MPPADDLVVVVRTAGERTIDVSLALLREQLADERILVVDERPFEMALRRTYELGIERAAAWTMTLDADVLLRQGAVAALLAEANRMPQHYLQIEGRIFDKLTGLYRQAGHRIYRTALLRQALEHIPPPGAAIRPEFTALQQMGRVGHPSRRVSLVVGLHDFEQYYCDIYRKAFVHARKHRYLVPIMVERCLANFDSDSDFRVLLKGLYDGITDHRDVSIDTRRFESFLAKDWLGDLGLNERAPFGPNEITLASFSGRYEAILAAEIPPRFDQFDEPQPRRSAGVALWDGYVRRLSHSGVWNGTIGAVGSVLARIGRRLETFEAATPGTRRGSEARSEEKPPPSGPI